jgi:hypothetical protein
VPSRSELKRALGRIDALERDVAALKTKARAKPPVRRAPARGTTRAKAAE